MPTLSFTHPAGGQHVVSGLWRVAVQHNLNMSLLTQGKTTLLKIIGGLAQHDCGLVRIGLGALDVASAAASATGSSSSTGSGSGTSATGANGSGKTNSIKFSGGGGGARAAAARTAQTGLVFQFPERHFLVRTAARRPALEDTITLQIELHARAACRCSCCTCCQNSRLPVLCRVGR